MTTFKPSLLAFALLSALVSCDDAAGGRPIAFALVLGAQPQSATTPANSFTTSAGWNVQLQEACIALGPLYIFRAPSHLNLAQQMWAWALPRAHAHVGSSHFGGKEVRGEWLGQAAVNALDPSPQAVGAHNALEGDVQSYSVLLNPPRGPLTSHPCLRGHHAFVVGVASKGEVVVAFEGGLQIENVGTNRQVEGLPLPAELRDGATVSVRVRPSAWFDLADFSSLTQLAPSGRFLITVDSQVHRTWFIGVRSQNAFVAETHAASGL